MALLQEEVRCHGASQLLCSSESLPSTGRACGTGGDGFCFTPGQQLLCGGLGVRRVLRGRQALRC